MCIPSFLWKKKNKSTKNRYIPSWRRPVLLKERKRLFWGQTSTERQNIAAKKSFVSQGIKHDLLYTWHIETHPRHLPGNLEFLMKKEEEIAEIQIRVCRCLV